MNDRNEGATFNNQKESEELRKQAQQERSQNPDAYSDTSNDLSTGNSVRNFGEVSGTTFGSDSNPAKFSNMGNDNAQSRSGIEQRNSSDAQDAG